MTIFNKAGIYTVYFTREGALARERTQAFKENVYLAECILHRRLIGGDDDIRPVLGVIETMLSMMNRGLNLDERLKELEAFRRSGGSA